jgi:peptidyl-prolyl cis-trans isomerase C
VVRKAEATSRSEVLPMSTWSREPLLHFAVLGAAIFAVHAWMTPGPNVGERQVIEVPAGQVERLADVWRRQWQRQPTEAELRAVVEQHVSEEVLYRQAVALGLDKDDSMIRQRLAQKVQFLSEDIAEVAEPDEATLRRFFEERATTYVEPPALTFSHVYFSRERRGPALDADAKRALAILARHSDAAPELGDPCVLTLAFTRTTTVDVASQLGPDFAAALRAVPLGSWQGPIPSPYGVHLVLMTERTEGRAPKLDEVRTEVLHDYRRAQRDAANRGLLEELRARYRIVVDEGAIGSAAARDALARTAR